MKPKFRCEVNVVLFERIDVMHTLVLILSNETEYHGPAFKRGMNVMLMEQFRILDVVRISACHRNGSCLVSFNILRRLEKCGTLIVE
jgi:hypothetical protein